MRGGGVFIDLVNAEAHVLVGFGVVQVKGLATQIRLPFSRRDHLLGEHRQRDRSGKPMIFGKDRDKGLVLDGFNIRVVTVGEGGVTESDVLVHDATSEDSTLHMKLAMMEGPDMPIAMGVIRDVVEETYDAAVEAQIAEVQAKSKVKTFDDLIDTCEQWDM